MSTRSPCGTCAPWWPAPTWPATTRPGRWPPACAKPWTDGSRRCAEWSEEIAKHLDDHQVVRALRLAARPPEPAARLDAALADRLSDAAGRALAPDAPAERWLALLEAVAASPVRRSVKPAGLPTDATPEVRRAAHQQSGRIPALAAMLGTSMPPPPVGEPTRKASSRRRSRAGDARGAGPAEGAAPAQESSPDHAVPDGAPPASQWQTGTPRLGTGPAARQPTTPQTWSATPQTSRPQTWSATPQTSRPQTRPATPQTSRPQTRPATPQTAQVSRTVRTVRPP